MSSLRDVFGLMRNVQAKQLDFIGTTVEKQELDTPFKINQYLGTYFRDQDEALRVQRKNMETVFQDHMNEIIAEYQIGSQYFTKTLEWLRGPESFGLNFLKEAKTVLFQDVVKLSSRFAA